MTDANGTRNIRTGDQSSSSSAGPSNTSRGTSQTGPAQSTSGASGSSINSRLSIERPKLSISSSQRLPSQRLLKPSAPADKPPVIAAPSTGMEVGTQSHKKVGDRPNSRYRATEEKTARRRRSQPHSSSERRRLFGTVPDRIKSKSSSRTRAIKAKTATPSTRIQARKQGRLLKKTENMAALAGKTAASTSAGKNRPALPNSAYPGRVPPARSLVRKRRRVNKKYTMIRRGIQLLIAGVGLAAIGGTLLKVLPSTPEPAPLEVAASPAPTRAKSFPVNLAQENSALKASLQDLPNLYPNLTPKVFYIDVDTGQYVSVEGTETVAAASTIKLPILLAFFEEIDAGRIDPNRTIAMEPSQVAEGSGDMQMAEPGTQFTALEVATQMIISSDNTATNMMIDLLGGQEILNARFQRQGLEKTVLNASLPDLEGTNTTSARDLVHTMLLISQGEDLTMRSRDRILNILNRTRNKSLLANGPIEQGALTYNKTGDIGSALGDVALVDLPNGKRYVIAALVERPINDGRAQDMINKISSMTYQEAAKAIQPALTPLGNAGRSADGAPSGVAPTTEDAPIGEPPLLEEEPYPSANPRTQP